MISILKMIPFGWKIGILLGLVLAMVGLYTTGYYIGYNKGLNVSKVKIEQFQKDAAIKDAEYEKKLSEKKTEIITKYVTNTETIKVKEKEYIQSATDYVPSIGTLTNGWVYTHNQAALLKDLDKTLASDASKSMYTDTNADKIIKNFIYSPHQ